MEKTTEQRKKHLTNNFCGVGPFLGQKVGGRNFIRQNLRCVPVIIDPTMLRLVFLGSV